MKSVIIILALLLGSATFNTITAQIKKETIKVAGNCSSCKKHIEKAALSAGATTAVWNKDSKQLKLSYAATKTSNQKIQQAIANVGYDTPDFKASPTAYDKLDECCQYERKTSTKN